MSTILRDLLENLAKDRVVIIAGTGVSIATTNSSPTASWDGLLYDGIERVLDVARPDRDPEAWGRRRQEDLGTGELEDLLSVATQIANRLGGPKGPEYRKWLQESVGTLHRTPHLEPSVIKALQALQAPIATTNYDHLIEHVTGYDPITWLDASHAGEWLRGVRQAVLHLHGYFDEPESVILSQSDYQRVLDDEKAQNVQRVLRSRSTLLFVGYGSGLADPNFATLMRWSRATFAEDTNRVLRLCRKSEIDAVKSEHDKDERVFPLAYGDNFSDLPLFLQSLAEVRAGTPSVVVPAPAPDVNPIQRPTLAQIPSIDPGDRFRDEFIGREDVVVHVEDALRGCASRFAGSELERSSDSLQVIWCHGIGGMGKSWFLRHACVRAKEFHEEFRAGLVDWGLPQWCDPVRRPPTRERDILDAVAHRTAQLYSTESLDEYWAAVAQVDVYAPKRAEIQNQITASLLKLEHSLQRDGSRTQGDWLPENEELLSNLVRHEIIPADSERQLATVQLMLRDNAKREQVLGVWATELLGAPSEEVLLRPTHVLAQALSGCLRQVSVEAPLLLVFDTCEHFDRRLEAFMVDFFGPLIDGSTALTLIIGSRRAPDASIAAGKATTWKDIVGRQRFREVDFDPNFHFTVSEIRRCLARAGIEDDQGALAERLHKFTSGYPNPVGAFVEMFSRGESTGLLEDVEADVGSSADSDALEKVNEIAVTRMLVHLESRGPESRDYLDTIVLGLLRRTDTALLGRYWETDHPLERLGELSLRYCLMAGQDLNPTVRTYFQRHWRKHPPKPLLNLANKLLACHAELNPGPKASRTHRIEWRMKQIHLQAWISPDLALAEAARVIVLGLEWRENLKDIVELIDDMRAANPEAESLFDVFGRPYGLQSHLVASNRTLLRWIKKRKTDQWSLEESASLDLLTGLSIHYRAEFADSELHGRAADLLKSAFRKLGSDYKPRQEALDAYLESVFQATISDPEPGMKRVETALDWARDIGEFPGFWKHTGCLLHNVGRHRESVEAFRKAVAEDPRDWTSFAFKSHAHQVHLNEPELAKEAIDHAIAIRPHHNGLKSQLAQILGQGLGRVDEAAAILEELIDDAWRPDEDLALQYAEMLQEVPSKAKSVREALMNALDSSPDNPRLHLGLAFAENAAGEKQSALQALEGLEAQIDSEDDPKTLNSIAWRMYTQDFGLSVANVAAQRAIKLSPDSSMIRHTLAAVLVRLDQWEQAEPHIAAWLDAQGDAVAEWPQDIDLFRDALKFGRGSDLVDLISGADPSNDWGVLRSALKEAVHQSGRELPEPSGSRDRIVRAVLEQLRSDERVSDFPS